jgi:hypothetical protein
MIAQHHIDALKEFLDTKAISNDTQEIEPHLIEWRDKLVGYLRVYPWFDRFFLQQFHLWHPPPSHRRFP